MNRPLMPQNADWQRLTVTINLLEEAIDASIDSEVSDALNVASERCDLLREVMEQGGSVPTAIVDVETSQSLSYLSVPR